MERPPPWTAPDPLPLPLETPRAVIDVHRDEDAPALLEAVDASRTRLLPWLPWAGTGHASAEDSLRTIRAFARERGFAHPESFSLGIFDRSRPRRVLGGTGFVHVDAKRRTGEIGYWIRADREGEGLATEVVGHLVSSAFSDWGLRRVVIGCDGANRASQRVAEKLGLRRETREVAARWLEGRGWSDHVGFAVLAGEWDARARRGPRGGAAKAFAATEPAVAPYVAALLEPEDALLAAVRAASTAAGLPDIAVGPFDGRHLEVIARAANARRIVEVGTLGGYSTICLARALPADGVLHTFELEPDHARVAEASLERAGLASKVRVHVGPAVERLGDIEADGPFDLIFLDADKAGYVDYLAWAERNVRVGGTLLADNVFRKPRGRPAADAVHAFNTRLVGTGLWRATFLPLEDGLAFAVRTADA